MNLLLELTQEIVEARKSHRCWLILKKPLIRSPRGSRTRGADGFTPGLSPKACVEVGDRHPRVRAESPESTRRASLPCLCLGALFWY